MNSKILIQIQENPPETHYFLYRGQKFPFSMDLFNASSKYFSHNQGKISQNNTVNLIDESFEGDLNFTNESIQNFISYFQRQQIPLTNENAVSLNYLAKKYELNMLIQITEQYIEENHNDLALQNILTYQNNESFPTDTFEDIIAERLDLYLNNDQFLSINLPIIYRILSKYQQRHGKTNSLTSKIIDFLFICLPKFGREASCLFSLIDAGDLSSEKVIYLLTDYSEIFDFHFINSSFLKTIYENQCDSIKNKVEIEKLKKESNDEINRLKKELDLQKQKEIENLNETKNQFEKIREEIDKLKETHLQTVNNNNKEINELKNELNEKEEEICNLKKILCLNFNVKIFNENNVEHQMIILKVINNEQINKVKDLLSFLLKINRNSSGIYILSEDDTEQQTNKVDDNFDFSKIVISKQMTEILYNKNELESSDFLQNINKFNEFYFEIQYPSKKYEDIYQKILEIKHSHIDKVKISIFISGIDSIDQHFRNNIEINRITFDSCIKEIKSSKSKEGSFEGCKSLKNITIPSNIKIIGPNSFKNCSSLEQIVIPYLRKRVKYSDFDGCESLTRVIVPSVKQSIPTANIDDYEINQLITNNYAIIFKGTNKITGKEVVIKAVPKYDFSYSAKFIAGTNISQIDLPGILRIQSFRFPLTNEEKSKVNLLKYKKFDLTGYIAISEYMINGNVDDITKKYLESKEKEKMNPTIRSKIIFGVAATMKQLHNRNIIHRNLTNVNILLDDKLEPRIGSFSFARFINDPFELEKFIGTPLSMAPELLFDDEKEYGFPIDVFAYSIFLYRLFSPKVSLNKTIWRSSHQYLDAIRKGERPKKVDNIPDHYWSLIEKCWDPDPSKRPTFDEITTILKDDKYALEEFGMKTDLDELHRYQTYIDSYI